MNKLEPLPFRPHVPIVGQPMDVEAWFPTVVLTCRCGSKRPIVMAGHGVIGQCRACGARVAIAQITVDVTTGQASIGIVSVGPAVAEGAAPS